MKTKLLTAAIAAVTLSSATAVMAENDITTALANGTISGEASGGYRNSSAEFGATKADSSDFDIDELRLGFTANVKENVVVGIELEWDAADDASNSGSTTLRDIYASSTFGTSVVTAGRFKQIADREAAVEQSDSVIGSSASLNTTSLSGFSGSLEELAISGSYMRRIDGIEWKYADDSGLNASASVSKGGVDNTGGDTDRNFGFAGSVGFQGGNEDLRFGVTLAAYQQNGDEFDNSVSIPFSSIESMGYGITFNGSVGPLTGYLSYNDEEVESDDGLGVANPDIEIDTLSFTGAVNLSGAARLFDQYGVLQGPKIGKGQHGYELGFNYTQSDIDAGSSLDSDLDSWALSISAYCGQYKKISLSYSDVEWDFGGSSQLEGDQIALTARLDF